MTDPHHDPRALGELAALGGAALVRQVLEALSEQLATRPAQAAAAAGQRDAEAVITAVHGSLSVAAYAGETAVREAGMAVERAARAGDWAAMDGLVARYASAATAALPRVTSALAQTAPAGPPPAP